MNIWGFNMKYLFTILLIIFLSCFVYELIKSKKRFNNFISFLKSENDYESLEIIGARFQGEDLSFQQRTSYTKLNIQLNKMFERTGKIEYKNYLEESLSSTKIMVAVFICIFISGCVLTVLLRSKT